LYGAATLGFLALPQNPPMSMVLALYALIGIPFAGIQVGPFALVAHLTHDAARATGMRQEGLFTGLWTAGEKLGLAIGPGIAGLGLALIGFHAGAAAQSPETTRNLTLLIAAGPSALLWLSMLLLKPGTFRTVRAHAAAQETT
jgi:Na+/melibiose symporter-like transporter